MAEEGGAFSERVLHRAFTETLGLFEAKPRTMLVGAALIVAGLVVHVWRDGLASLTKDLGQTFLDSLLPVLAVGLGLFLWNLWLAPFLLLLEVRKPDAPPAQTPPTPVDISSFKLRKRLNAHEASSALAIDNPSDGTFEGRKEMYKRLVVERCVRVICLAICGPINTARLSPTRPGFS
jgi:hypothetical protein